MKARHPILRGSDQGSVLILTIGFAVLLMLFIAVVVDSSKLFLTRRGLASLADGAAVAAAQDVDVATIYRSPSGEALPLLAARARADVDAYVRRTAPETGLTDVQIVATEVVGTDVRVTLTARSMLPLISTATGATDGVLMTVTATARAAVAR